jgi:hypothetical protein
VSAHASDQDFETPNGTVLAFNLGGYVDPGDTIEFSITSPPGHGHIQSINTINGYVWYAPDAGYEGDDSFDWEVTTGGSTAGATVSITVLPATYGGIEPMDFPDPTRFTTHGRW